MKLVGEDLDQAVTILGRKPTEVEQSILATMWSEHCSYKSSKTILKKFFKSGGSEVLIGIGEDAGIVALGEYDGELYGIALAHESHNHPSQILPVEGAATGVGGVVRDVYCMGADVLGVLNSLHFGTDSKNPYVSEIAQKVVHGVSDYANPLGVPVLGGETLYHSSYNDNCLVNVAAVGLVKADRIIHSYVPKAAKDTPYDIILIGKSTDATGFGGASFSSATLDTDNESANIGAVQVHDPFLKRVLVEAIQAVLEDVHTQGIEIGFKDLGAGGISCAASEIAAHSGFGVTLRLDDVNMISPSLPPQIVACSETQERFCLAVPKTYSKKVLEIINDSYEMSKIYPNAGAVIIGEVVNDDRFIMMAKGEKVCDLPIHAITTEVQANRQIGNRVIQKTAHAIPEQSHSQIQALCENILNLPNVRSKQYIYRHFDSGVKGNTVTYPGEGDAVVIRPFLHQKVGVATSMDSNLYGHIDPYISGAYAVAEAVRNIVSVGAVPMAITDCLNFGNPEVPDYLFDFQESVRGIADAAKAFGFKEPLPIISGNVSFYNESKNGRSVIPSPVVMAVGRVSDVDTPIASSILEAGLDLLIVGERYDEFGGTQIAEVIPNLPDSCAPQVRFEEEAKMNRAVQHLIQTGQICSCHDISQGGAWVSVCEMILAPEEQHTIGGDIQIGDRALMTTLFSESGGYILAVSPTKSAEIQQYLKDTGVVCHDLGVTTENNQISISTESETVASFPNHVLFQSWHQPLVTVK